MAKHLLDAAIAYARRGWAVHPVNLQKKPTTEHGFYDATTDEPTIQRYFANGAQISIRTGAASGVFVLDLDEDPEKGYSVARTLTMIAERYGPLPHTPHQRTGRGGLQYFFKHQEGLRNKAGSLLGPGIDTRGEGGYAVVAPSRNTNGAYEWIVSPDEAPLADAPAWLVELMTKRTEQPARPTTGAAPEAYAQAALANEVSAVLRAQNGTRNDTLNRAAFSLGQLVGAGLLGRDQVEQALRGAAGAAGLAAREIDATIKSGLDAGEQDPRKVPDRKTRATATPEEPPHPADVADDVDDEPIAPIALGPISSFVELPAAARLPEELGRAACPWLDEYIAFSRHWSPRSYDDFHEACGLWVLSTIAARRVMLPLGGERFTNLYIALCARSSLWAKSTAARIAMDTVRAAGLADLLAPDNATPQAFIRELSARVPSDWGNLPGELRDRQLTRLAFVGQRGWHYEEFGEQLAAMMRENSVMADYRSHIRRFDDCPGEYTYVTVSRGANTVERPYLALLANLTPADLAPFARKGSALWSDGYFARFAFITPPTSAEHKRDRFPLGWRTVPDSLAQPLRTWHECLGIPEVAIEERTDDKGKPSGEYSLTITPVAPQRCTLGEGVFDAFYAYSDALRDLVAQSESSDLDGSYIRFAEKALRIAMLLAGFSHGGRIELAHWARGQAIAERWRRNLHNLVDQLGQAEDTPERALENKTMRLFTRCDVLTAREAGRFLHISTGEAERILDQLVKAGELKVEAGKRTKRYRPAAASVASVTVSQVSQGVKNCDTSPQPPGPPQEVSQDLEERDTCDIVTVATLPTEDVGRRAGGPVDPAYRVARPLHPPSISQQIWREQDEAALVDGDESLE